MDQISKRFTIAGSRKSPPSLLPSGKPRNTIREKLLASLSNSPIPVESLTQQLRTSSDKLMKVAEHLAGEGQVLIGGNNKLTLELTPPLERPGWQGNSTDKSPWMPGIPVKRSDRDQNPIMRSAAYNHPPLSSRLHIAKIPPHGHQELNLRLNSAGLNLLCLLDRLPMSMARAQALCGMSWKSVREGAIELHRNGYLILAHTSETGVTLHPAHRPPAIQHHKIEQQRVIQRERWQSTPGQLRRQYLYILAGSLGSTNQREMEDKLLDLHRILRSLPELDNSGESLLSLDESTLMLQKTIEAINRRGINTDSGGYMEIMITLSAVSILATNPENSSDRARLEKTLKLLTTLHTEPQPQIGQLIITDALWLLPSRTSSSFTRERYRQLKALAKKCIEAST